MILRVRLSDRGRLLVGKLLVRRVTEGRGRDPAGQARRKAAICADWLARPFAGAASDLNVRRRRRRRWRRRRR